MIPITVIGDHDSRINYFTYYSLVVIFDGFRLEINRLLSRRMSSDWLLRFMQNSDSPMKMKGEKLYYLYK